MKVNLLTRERLSLLGWALIITYIILAVYQLGDFGPNTGGIKKSDYVLLWSASNLAGGRKTPGPSIASPSCAGSKPLSGTICTTSSRGSIPRRSSCSSCPWAPALPRVPGRLARRHPLGCLAVLRRIAPDPLTRTLAVLRRVLEQRTTAQQPTTTDEDDDEDDWDAPVIPGPRAQTAAPGRTRSRSALTQR